MKSGIFPQLKIPLIILAILFIAGGIVIWISAVILAKIDDGIKTNTLVMHGIYAYCRNPIYTAVTFVNIGALLFMNNLWLLILPSVYWAFMTILMKHTEKNGFMICLERNTKNIAKMSIVVFLGGDANEVHRYAAGNVVAI